MAVVCTVTVRRVRFHYRSSGTETWRRRNFSAVRISADVQNGRSLRLGFARTFTERTWSTEGVFRFGAVFTVRRFRLHVIIAEIVPNSTKARGNRLPRNNHRTTSSTISVHFRRLSDPNYRITAVNVANDNAPIESNLFRGYNSPPPFPYEKPARITKKTFFLRYIYIYIPGFPYGVSNSGRGGASS